MPSHVYFASGHLLIESTEGQQTAVPFEEIVTHPRPVASEAELEAIRRHLHRKAQETVESDARVTILDVAIRNLSHLHTSWEAVKHDE